MSEFEVNFLWWIIFGFGLWNAILSIKLAEANTARDTLAGLFRIHQEDALASDPWDGIEKYPHQDSRNKISELQAEIGFLKPIVNALQEDSRRHESTLDDAGRAYTDLSRNHEALKKRIEGFIDHLGYEYIEPEEITKKLPGHWRKRRKS